MTPIVRTVGIGRCSLLGELIDETEIRYFYRRRSGYVLAFVEKQSPVIGEDQSGGIGANLQLVVRWRDTRQQSSIAAVQPNAGRSN